MTETQHDFSGFALGKRKSIDAPALMLKDVLTGVVPATPVAADHFSQISEWNLGGNDRFGTCGPTGTSNHLLLTTAYLGDAPIRVTDEDIFDLYRRSGNPGFDPNKNANDPDQQDNGVILQKMLGALLSGGIGGHKPLAYAKVAAGDTDTLDKAIAIFGGVLLGLDLEVAQQRQSVWDYSASSEWGGHCVLAGRYSDPEGTAQDRTGVITWAEAVDTTRNFINHQEDEAWVVIWPEHLGSKTFLEGVNVEALASAYEDLTGRPFPVPVPPAPTPDPTPTPTPGPGPAPSPSDDTDAALQAALQRYLKGSSAPKYLRGPAEAWLAEYF